MTASEVHERLEEELAGQGRAQEIPVLRSVKRWLNRWVEDGVLALGGKVRVDGVPKPLATYCTPSHGRACGELILIVRCPLPYQIPWYDRK